MDNQKVSARKLMHDKCRENLAAGAKLLFARRFEDALSKFQKVLVFDPENANAFALKSKCYLQMCDLKSAIANLKKAVRLDPEEVDWNKQLSILIDAQGLNLLDQVRSKVPGWQNLIQRAIEFFNSAIEADSGEPYFWLHRAIAFTLRQDYVSAVSDLDRYVSIDAENCEVFIMLAKLHWRLNNQQAGQRNLGRAHKVDPLHPEVQILKRSMAKRNQLVYQRTARSFLGNDCERTVEELDRALQVSPSNVNMLLLRAAAHRKLGNLQESLTDIKRAKDIYTRSVMEHRRTLLTRRRKDGSGASPTNFSQVEELPEIVVQRNHTLNEMALREMRAGHFRAAWSIFDRVVQSDAKLAERDSKFQQNPAFLLNRGDAQREAKNWEKAFEDYWSALKLDPKSLNAKGRISLVYNEFAVTQFNQKQYQKAALLYTKALDMFPDAAHFYLGRAKSYFYDGRLRHAYEDLLKAVEKDPNNAEAAERLKHLTATFRVSGEVGGSLLQGRGVAGRSPRRGGGSRSAPRRGKGHRGKSVKFPPMGQKDNIAIKLVPGRNTKEHVVPQSFGSGFQVMPKSDTRRSKFRQNSMRTTRPIP